MEQGNKGYVRDMVKKHDVKFIRLWFTDIQGYLKSFAITVGELETALEEGMGLDAVQSGTGKVLAGFREIPAACLPETQDILNRLDQLGFSGMLARTKPAHTSNTCELWICRLGYSGRAESSRCCRGSGNRYSQYVPVYDDGFPETDPATVILCPDAPFTTLEPFRTVV